MLAMQALHGFVRIVDIPEDSCMYTEPTRKTETSAIFFASCICSSTKIMIGRHSTVKSPMVFRTLVAICDVLVSTVQFPCASGFSERS
jgi:hypothetical protein